MSTTSLPAYREWTKRDLEMVLNDTRTMCGQAQRQLDILESAVKLLTGLAERERASVDEYQRAAAELVEELRRRAT